MGASASSSAFTQTIPRGEEPEPELPPGKPGWFDIVADEPELAVRVSAHQCISLTVDKAWLVTPDKTDAAPESTPCDGHATHQIDLPIRAEHLWVAANQVFYLTPKGFYVSQSPEAEPLPLQAPFATRGIGPNVSVSGRSLLAVADKTIFRLEGKAWSKVLEASAVVGMPDGIAFAVGGGGTLFKSVDEGKTWKPVDYPLRDLDRFEQRRDEIDVLSADGRRGTLATKVEQHSFMARVRHPVQAGITDSDGAPLDAARQIRRSLSRVDGCNLQKVWIRRSTGVALCQDAKGGFIILTTDAGKTVEEVYRAPDAFHRIWSITVSPTEVLCVHRPGDPDGPAMLLTRTDKGWQKSPVAAAESDRPEIALYDRVGRSGFWVIGVHDPVTAPYQPFVYRTQDQYSNLLPADRELPLSQLWLAHVNRNGALRIAQMGVGTPIVKYWNVPAAGAASATTIELEHLWINEWVPGFAAYDERIVDAFAFAFNPANTTRARYLRLSDDGGKSFVRYEWPQVYADAVQKRGRPGKVQCGSAGCDFSWGQISVIWRWGDLPIAATLPNVLVDTQ